MSIGIQRFKDRYRAVGIAGASLVVGLAGCMLGGCQSGARNTQALNAGDYPTAPVLHQLVGKWKVEGTDRLESGETMAWTGTATGAVDKLSFLRIDMQVRDPRNGQTVEGTTVIGQDGGRLLTMVSTHSSAPGLRVYQGELDADGKVITLTQIGRAAGSGRQLVLRHISNDHWTAEARSSRGDQPSETMTLRRTQ